MKKITILTSFFILVSVLMIGCSQKVRQEDILVKFDKQIITVSEFEKKLSELPEWKRDRYKDQAGKAEYLNELAEEKLITLAAKDRELHKDPEVIKQVNEYRDQLMLKELVKREVDDKIKITDADLEKYYSEHKEDYIEPEKVVVTEITLKDEAKAKEVLEKIKSGADFTELAKEMDSKGESFGPGAGNGGKTRPFSRDSYSSAKEFVETAFKLKPGEMSDIIVQPLGQDTYYMIIRVDEHNPSRQKELSEVKDQVESSVEREKKKERLYQWLDEVKKERKFQLFTERIPKVPEKVEEDKAKQETPQEETSEKTEESQQAK